MFRKLFFYSFFVMCIYLPSQVIAQWTKTNSPHGSIILAFATIGDTILAGTTSDFINQGGIYKSIDNGLTWDLMLTNLPRYADIRCFGLSQNGNKGTSIIIGTEGSIFRSSNYGASWTKIEGNIDIAGTTSIIIKDEHLFASSFTDGIFYSKDNGANWTNISSGIPDLKGAGRPGAKSITALLLWDDPSKEKTLFAGYKGVKQSKDSAGVFLSTDYGTSWKVSRDGFPPFVIIYHLLSGINSLGNKNIYAGTDAGFYFSSDSGSTWKRSWLGIATSNINTIVTIDTNVFIGTDSGVYFSTNLDSGWVKINEGFTYHDIRSMHIHENYIYAGTSGQGIWRRPLSEMLSVSNEQAENPSYLTLYQNHPNPFNPSTTIEYSVQKQTHVALNIYNTLGRHIITLVNGAVEPGIHNAQFDASNLESGSYLYMLTNKDGILSKWMTVVK